MVFSFSVGSPGRFLRLFLLSAFSGVLAGISATLFLFLLQWVTQYRVQHSYIIWMLPLAGLGIGWSFWHFGQGVLGGNNLVLDEIHDPKRTIPFRMAPFILLGTLVTHLFGGSAGREGTAVQMGASLSDQIARIFRVTDSERRCLLMAGAGAGFGAAIGAPLAGAIFGVEMVVVRGFRWQVFLDCLVASFFGYYTTLFLQAPHTHYPHFVLPTVSIKILMIIALCGVVFGGVARLFVDLVHAVAYLCRRWIAYAPMRPFFGGLLLVFLYYWEASYRYAGLGLSVIQDAFFGQSVLWDPVFKLGFTVLTVGSGFKGGEFIPLVFIGATLGAAMGLIVPVSVSLLAGVGFAAVFGAASNTPLACAVMAMELFGWSIAPYALIGCGVAWWVSGYRSIYQSQCRGNQKEGYQSPF